jgi:hypothetical protein
MRFGVRAAAGVTVCGVALMGFLAAGEPAGASGTFSGFLAGYEGTTSSDTTQTIETTFSVPTANCAPVKATGHQLLGVAAEIYDAAVFPDAMVGMAVSCFGHTASYIPVGQAGATTQDLSLTVHPGDSITVSMSVSAESSSATMTDGTQSQTVSGIGGNVSSGSFELGAFRSGCGSASKCAAVPKISKITFTASSVSSSSLKGATRDQLTDAKGAIQLKSGKLASDDSGFSVNWLLSCGVGQKPC